jgi:acid phosphatase
MARFESAAYGHDFKLSGDEKRTRKLGVLQPWPAKP